MREVVNHCESAELDIYNTETIVNWYVFLQKNNVATLEGNSYRSFLKVRRRKISMSSANIA